MAGPVAPAATLLVDGPARSAARPALVIGSVAFAVAVIALMQTISIPLLPALPDAFDTSIASVSWVATTTLIVGAAVNPIIGRMGDVYGKRRLMLACLGAAAAGTVVSATADSLLVVIAGRAVQGLGSGVIPLSYGIIRDELPARLLSRGVAMVTAAGAGIGAGLGPVVMGAVVSTHGWRAVFWLTGGLLVVALVLVRTSTSGAGARLPARFDVPGAVVLALALVVLLLAITNGSRWGWTSAPVVALVVSAGGMAVWWLRWERSQDDPIVDLDLNGRGPVLLAHLGGVMVGFATFAQYISSFTLVSLPAASGHGLGRSLAVAGLVQVPGAIVLTVAVLAAPRIGATHGSSTLLRLSATALVAGFGLAFVRHGSIWDVVLSVTVICVGLGIGQCAVPIMVLEHVGQGQTAAVNAVSALARVVGSVLASALVTTVLAAGSVVVGATAYPAEWTFQVAYVIGALPAVAVGFLSWRSSRLACNSS
jgi:MFS family permease